MGGEPPRSRLECQGWLAYARKGLASGQPADIRKGETKPRQQFRKRQSASCGSSPSSATGFAGQVPSDSWSNVARLSVKCTRFAEALRKLVRKGRVEHVPGGGYRIAVNGEDRSKALPRTVTAPNP